MTTKPDISVIILTYNEELHIERCIASLADIAKAVFVVDCYSTDRTCELAESLGAQVFKNNWVNYATQFNWALNNLPIRTDWVFRLDADEIVTDTLRDQLCKNLGQLTDEVTGVYIGRRMNFMGKWIRHGAMYPIYVMRIFQYGKGFCEQRWMDEHIKTIEGTSRRFTGDIVDDNLNNLGWWTNKHNNYALREAIDLLNLRFVFLDEDGIVARLTGTQEQRKRWLKIRYASLPLFFRPFIYFIYRYFLKVGFLDGKEGLVWHFLQGFWYRFLVDAKILEIYLKGGTSADSIRQLLDREYGIKLDSQPNPAKG